MADLTTTFAGIRSPNPFWLASAPPTDKAYNVNRAFEAGWGGVVWKTLGEEGPPIVNVNGPRYGALLSPDRRMLGFNNIELITDRPLQLNLAEIRQIKRDWPDRALVVSLMVPCTEDAWKAILPAVEDTGCDGVELNFGCPHGMSERGMGAAVGQVPEYIRMVTAWCKQYSQLPVIVKLTPNITDIRQPALAAKQGGADAVSLINTINSIMGVDPLTLAISPATDGKGSHGGYCGPAVKPIALNMVAEIGRWSETRGIPVSGIGGIGNWRDALDYFALGAGNVQVCTAAMVYGFKIVQEMSDGLSNYMDDMGFASIEDFRGRALPTVTDWQYLNLNAVSKAVIDQDKCIECGRCHIVCEDTSHQAITAMKDGRRHFEVKEDECVGCNLCVTVCPVPECITLRTLAPGELDQRTGQTVSANAADWTTHPNNPMRKAVPA
ncbi:NAD-dependent dihydropyrimidine dehydrogenase subunit PreA [Aquabacterium sp.]|uniref:NAD-dependent dihydropyrimidine dehydrogenase subunit PreA n=1 Tax=Aquabacterium sp. TaxID=1872578 RepID=UPI002BD1ECE2|nr:NAD-dependent dihydropyrimidine dehydrogenase subunit PreA [Aquabacterium sp.]HSW07374.1 NAD-dependent dihydropyrimidine dehydrogenase subunit PreA [Aquabacterium sp.]